MTSIQAEEMALVVIVAVLGGRLPQKCCPVCNRKSKAVVDIVYKLYNQESCLMHLICLLVFIAFGSWCAGLPGSSWCLSHIHPHLVPDTNPQLKATPNFLQTLVALEMEWTLAPWRELPYPGKCQWKWKFCRKYYRSWLTWTKSVA